jgi:hypothetical protein
MLHTPTNKLTFHSLGMDAGVRTWDGIRFLSLFVQLRSLEGLLLGAFLMRMKAVFYLVGNDYEYTLTSLHNIAREREWPKGEVQTFTRRTRS